VQDELILLDSVKLRQPSFGEGPEGLYAIDVAFAADELVAAIIDPVMVVAVEHVPVVGLPAVGVDRAALEHFALYRRQKSGPAHRGDNRREDLSAPLEKVEYRCLAGTPRPRLPRTLRAPKKDSSTSISPERLITSLYCHESICSRKAL
jgi:hypothetical protein